jgi:hypothetical protein
MAAVLTRRVPPAAGGRTVIPSHGPAFPILWFGYRADPTTSYASLGGMWLFAGLPAVELIPAYLFLWDFARPLATNT